MREFTPTLILEEERGLNKESSAGSGQGFTSKCATELARLAPILPPLNWLHQQQDHLSEEEASLSQIVTLYQESRKGGGAVTFEKKDYSLKAQAIVTATSGNKSIEKNITFGKATLNISEFCSMVMQEPQEVEIELQPQGKITLTVTSTWIKNYSKDLDAMSSISKMTGLDSSTGSGALDVADINELNDFSDDEHDLEGFELDDEDEGYDEDEYRGQVDEEEIFKRAAAAAPSHRRKTSDSDSAEGSDDIDEESEDGEDEEDDGGERKTANGTLRAISEDEDDNVDDVHEGEKLPAVNKAQSVEESEEEEDDDEEEDETTPPDGSTTITDARRRADRINESLLSVLEKSRNEPSREAETEEEDEAQVVHRDADGPVSVNGSKIETTDGAGEETPDGNGLDAPLVGDESEARAAEEKSKTKKKAKKKKVKKDETPTISVAEYDKLREEFTSFITESEAAEKEYEAKVASLEKKVEALKSGADMSEYEGEALLEEMESVEQRALKAEEEVAEMKKSVRELEEQARQNIRGENGTGTDAVLDVNLLENYKEENQKLKKKVKQLKKSSGNSGMEAKVRVRTFI